MPDGKKLVQLAGLGALYILASPIYGLLALRRLGRTMRGLDAARSGWVVCPNCEERNPTDGLATCRRCQFTEFGSLLYCTNCRQVTRTLDCRGCRATIRVL